MCISSTGRARPPLPYPPPHPTPTQVGGIQSASIAALNRVHARTHLSDHARAACAQLDQRKQRQEWLAARSTLSITAGEAAAVLGVSSFQNVCTLYDAHTTGKKTFVHAAMIRGTALEPRAVADYSASTGLPWTSTGGRQRVVMRVRAHSRSQRAVMEGDGTCEAR